MAVGGNISFEVDDGRFIDQNEKCQLCDKVEFDGYCNQCEIHLCQICFDNHLRSRLCRDHLLLKDKDKHNRHGCAIRFDFCNEHKLQEVKAYCTEHKCCGCTECILLRHKSCKWQYIVEASDEFQSSGELARLLEEVQSIEFTLDTYKEEIDKYTETAEALNKDVRADIESFTDSLVKYVAESKQQVLKDTNIRETAHQQTLDKLKKDVQSLGSKVEEIISDFRNEGIPHKRFILALETMPKVALIQNELASIDCNNVIADYTFRQSNLLRRMMSNKRPIGRLTGDSQTTEGDQDDDEIELKNERAKNKLLQQQLDANQKIVSKQEKEGMSDMGQKYKRVIKENKTLQQEISTLKTSDVQVCAQDEKTGDIYRISKCYEQLGNYNKAVEVLFKREKYELAIDALKRYKALIKTFEENGEQIPQQLLDNSPEGYTEDNMIQRAADMYDRLRNKERMLAVVDRLENVKDKIEFLKNRNYIQEAAETYDENNDLENAIHLLLINGYVNEAVTMARKSLQEEFIAHTLLVACRRRMSRLEENTEKIPDESLKQDLDEAGALYASMHDLDHVGEVAVLQARLCYKLETVKKGWKSFLNSKPFANEPGILECCNLLVQNETHENIVDVGLMVKGIKYLFQVCKTFQDMSNKADMNKIIKYYQFYGLEFYRQDKLVVHPKLKPVFLQMSRNLKLDKTKVEVEVDKIKAHESIVDYLLQRGASWLEKVHVMLEHVREGRIECTYYAVGVECYKIGDVDYPCKRMHSTMTHDQYRQLIDIDLLMIEFEKVVQDGMADLATKYDGMKSVIDRLNLENIDPSVRYKACQQLWNDILPPTGHPLIIDTDSRKFLDYLRKNHQVVTHFKNYLVGRWDRFTSGRNKFGSKAVKESEGYLMFQFGYYLFGLAEGKVTLSRSPMKEITTLENRLDKEVANKPSLYRERNSFTLMMDKERDYNARDGRICVTCAAHGFVEALEYLTTGSPNPLESVIKFSKFQIHLSTRRDPKGKFYPELKHYLLWLEFFTSLSIMSLAKLKAENFDHFRFFLPNHYHALIHFIEASLPSSSYPIEDSIAWWDPTSHKKMKIAEMLSERLKGFTFVISGHAQKVKILDKIIAKCSKEITNLALLERFLILGLTMICNIGQAVPVKSELSLLSTLSHIELPDGASDRLTHAVCSMKECTGISGVAKVLTDLLDKRKKGEQLMVCSWRLGKKSRIEKVTFQDYKILSNGFYKLKTLPAIQASHIMSEPMRTDEPIEEFQQDEEEMQKGLRDKKAQLEEDQLKEMMENKAATLIQRTFKAFCGRKRKLCDTETGTEAASDVHERFRNRQIDDNMCGVCGYSFADKVANILDAKESMLVVGQSILNTGKAEEPWTKPLNKRTSVEDGRVSPNTTKNYMASSHSSGILQQVKNDHLNEREHLRLVEDLGNFKVKYVEEIEPNHRKIRQFLDDPDYNLSDDNFVRKLYGQEVIGIERLKSLCFALEKELNLLMSRPKWNEMQAYWTGDRMPPLMKTFNSVEPYVKENHLRWKQKQDRKSALKQDRNVVADDDLYDDEVIEDVVEEPEPLKTAGKFRYRRAFSSRRK